MHISRNKSEQIVLSFKNERMNFVFFQKTRRFSARGSFYYIHYIYMIICILNRNSFTPDFHALCQLYAAHTRKATKTAALSKYRRPFLLTYLFRFRIGDISFGIFKHHKSSEHVNMISVELFVLFLPLENRYCRHLAHTQHRILGKLRH